MNQINIMVYITTINNLYTNCKRRLTALRIRILNAFIVRLCIYSFLSSKAYSCITIFTTYIPIPTFVVLTY